MSQVLHQVRCAFACPDCGGWHMRWLPAADGKLASRVVVFGGDGDDTGHVYALTEEDIGQVDSVSVPVYRSVHQIDERDLEDFIRLSRREV